MTHDSVGTLEEIVRDRKLGKQVVLLERKIEYLVNYKELKCFSAQ